MLSLLLKMLHVILPFMFGPILAALLCVKVLKLKIRWPFWLSQIGLILLGVQIGSTFTQQVIKDISKNWSTIVFVTILLILLALIIAFFFKKIAQVNLETAILSVIPGALSQMLVMAEENKKANILVVSLTQTSRVIFVVILVPLISYFFQDNHHEMNHSTMEVPALSQTLNIWQIIILFSMVGIIYIGMSKINFPTKQLLAPIIVLIIWNMTTHLTFSLDHWLLATAQLIYMIQNIMLIVTTFIMIIGIHLITNESINELFLGAAPGGMSQIVLVAMATGADVAMISSYHIFRIFFILFVIAPLIGYFINIRLNEK